MEGETENGLMIDAAPNGRNGQATLTVRLAGEVVTVETFNLTKPKVLADFIKRLCDGRPGIDAKAVEKKLLDLAADLANKLNAPPAADAGSLPELDTSMIVRPERFIVSQVSGLAVPTMTVMGDKPVGRWLLYLRWADGKRERRPMTAAIALPDQRRLWIHPEPAAPTARALPGWSAAARANWLNGAAPCEPADLFKRICERIAYLIDFPREHAAGTTSTLTLWVLLTYIYQAWPAVPYLYIGGPLQSGKTRLFDILSRLAFRGLVVSSMKAATMFRTLHDRGGTLLLDEAEQLKQSQNPDVGEILPLFLAGYKCGGQAMRMEPLGDGGFKAVYFDVFGPKALACIAGLPPALASRCITVTMFRAAPNSEKPRRRTDADPKGWQTLRNDLHAVAMEHGPTWLDLAQRTDVCPTMSGRDYELWQPLLALASWVESKGARGLLKLLQNTPWRQSTRAKMRLLQTTTKRCCASCLTTSGQTARRGPVTFSSKPRRRTRCRSELDAQGGQHALETLRVGNPQELWPEGLRAGDAGQAALSRGELRHRPWIRWRTGRDIGAGNVPYVPYVPRNDEKCREISGRKGT